MFIKDLKPGDRFTTPNTHGTVYTVESVRCGDSRAVVTYTIDGGRPNVFTVRPLSTCTLV